MTVFHDERAPVAPDVLEQASFRWIGHVRRIAEHARVAVHTWLRIGECVLMKRLHENACERHVRRIAEHPRVTFYTWLRIGERVVMKRLHENAHERYGGR